MGATVPAALQHAGLPDIVVAEYGSGRCEARLRGSREVIAEAADRRLLRAQLVQLYPSGFSAEFRDDPWM
jgi:hypothetical protein